MKSRLRDDAGGGPRVVYTIKLAAENFDWVMGRRARCIVRRRF
jgi:hypothetical protein